MVQLPSETPFCFRNLLKKSFTAIDKKIEDKNLQYNINRETAKNMSPIIK